MTVLADADHTVRLGAGKLGGIHAVGGIVVAVQPFAVGAFHRGQDFRGEVGGRRIEAGVSP